MSAHLFQKNEGDADGDDDVDGEEDGAQVVKVIPKVEPEILLIKLYRKISRDG